MPHDWAEVRIVAYSTTEYVVFLLKRAQSLATIIVFKSHNLKLTASQILTPNKEGFRVPYDANLRRSRRPLPLPSCVVQFSTMSTTCQRMTRSADLNRWL